MRFTGVIPARYHSTRLPGKTLIDLAGKPMVQWVYERAKGSGRLDEVLVATDDRRISETVERFGGQARLTSARHQSGTDRIAEVAKTVDSDVFVNIQGDEPLLSPATIDAVCAPFLEDPELQVVTARVALHDPAEAARPDVVKVVTNQQGFALYFSRSLVPYCRSGQLQAFKHLGIYGYRRQFLLSLSQLKPSQLEESEKLEQLRFLDNGIAVRVVTVMDDSIGIDTPEDVERVRPMLQNAVVGSGEAEPLV